MKNIIEILKSLNIEVPAEKESELTKAVAENYKTIAEVDKKINKLETERDGFKERAEAAEETLKDFEGKDFDAITKERDEWQAKYEQRLKEEAEAKEKTEFETALNTAIESAKGKNAKAIIANLDIEVLRASKNRDKDIADAIKALADSEDTKFMFATDPEEKRAKFTAPQNNNNDTGHKYTMSELMKMKNENPDLDIESLMS